MYMDEAGFNLTKRRRRGSNVIGHRTIVGVPGQRGGNVIVTKLVDTGRRRREPANIQHILITK